MIRISADEHIVKEFKVFFKGEDISDIVTALYIDENGLLLRKRIVEDANRD